MLVAKSIHILWLENINVCTLGVEAFRGEAKLTLCSDSRSFFRQRFSEMSDCCGIKVQFVVYVDSHCVCM